MRDLEHDFPRLLGYVRVQVASQVYSLPVQAVSLKKSDGTTIEPGFVADGAHLGILVDSEASDAVVKAQIARASVDAERHISRKLLN
jgi:hypothetical protein